MPPARDHKKIFDDDKGSNTGGMRCYSTPKLASPKLMREIEKKIIGPTIMGLKKEGFPFVGMLFTGIMVTESGPKALEYNARFGDPETQTLLPLLESDLAEIMLACVEGRSNKVRNIRMYNGSCAVVVMSESGYPGVYREGDLLKIEDAAMKSPELNLFHAGTRMGPNGSVVTAGGRVMAIAATGSTLEEAVESAYAGVDAVHFADKYCQKDIARRALEGLGRNATGGIACCTL